MNKKKSEPMGSRKDPKTFYPNLTYREYSNLAMISQTLDQEVSEQTKAGRLSYISGVALEIAKAMYDSTLEVAPEIRQAANEWIEWGKEAKISINFSDKVNFEQ